MDQKIKEELRRLESHDALLRILAGDNACEMAESVV